MKRLLLLPAIVALSAGTAFAQSSSQTYVTVDLGDIQPEIAANVAADPDAAIPDTVNVQPWLAETVCGIDSAELSAQLQGGHAYCMAVQNSPELMQVVEQVMVAGYTSNDPNQDDTDQTITGGIPNNDSDGDDGPPEGDEDDDVTEIGDDDDDDTPGGDDGVDTEVGGDTEDGLTE